MEKIEKDFFEEMDKIIKKFEKETEEFEKKQKDLIHIKNDLKVN